LPPCCGNFVTITHKMGGGKQKIANNIKNGMLKEKYQNIFPSTL
jgi:hypothetical protein